MPTNERDRAILQALEKAGTKDPELSTFYLFHNKLFEMLAQAKGDISATLEMADAEALEARLFQGLPLVSFSQLPVEADRFAGLVSTVAVLLMEYNPDLAEQRVPESSTGCLVLARHRFQEGLVIEGEAGKEQTEDAGEGDLSRMSVDLALKPYLEWAAERVLPQVDQERWKRRYCPVCGGAPDFACLDDESGARHLVCSRCSSRWIYRRLECPFCGTNDHTKLSYYLGEDEAYRLYVCNACRRYLKAIDLRKVGYQVLFPVERLKTVGMDVAAQQEGYR
jgi:FdhE protein